MKEYLEDYASKKTKQTGEKTIEQEVQTIENEKIKEKLVQILEKIENNERDFRF